MTRLILKNFKILNNVQFTDASTPEKQFAIVTFGNKEDVFEQQCLGTMNIWQRTGMR